MIKSVIFDQKSSILKLIFHKYRKKHYFSWVLENSALYLQGKISYFWVFAIFPQFLQKYDVQFPNNLVKKSLHQKAQDCSISNQVFMSGYGVPQVYMWLSFALPFRCLVIWFYAHHILCWMKWLNHSEWNGMLFWVTGFSELQAFFTHQIFFVQQAFFM